MNSAWTVRLGRQAEHDYVEILRWTKMSFGEVQARTYSVSISLAIRALKDGPEILGSRLREEIGPGIRTLHVARSGRKGRHFVVFRATHEHRIHHPGTPFTSAASRRRKRPAGCSLPGAPAYRLGRMT